MLEAADGAAALELWRQHRGAIRLLFTDAVMPGGINGTELAAQLLAEQPELRVILASGYSPELARRGLPEGHVTFLAKPYDSARVAAAVRAALPAVAHDVS